ncbi:hypothetical protein [Profundibacter sp.]
MSVSGDKTSIGMMRIALNAMLLNVLNLKLSLFFLAFLPQFPHVDAGGATGTGLCYFPPECVGMGQTGVCLTFRFFGGRTDAQQLTAHMKV